MEIQTFSQRLKVLIGSDSVSAFARRVKLSESLIRKYLAGSEPGLKKSVQICQNTGCSLAWLAGLSMEDVIRTEAIDKQTIKAVTETALQLLHPDDQSIHNTELVQLIIRLWQCQHLQPSLVHDSEKLQSLASQWLEKPI